MDLAHERLTEELQAEIQPLIEAHYHEIALYKDIPLEVSWAAYWDAQERGNLAAYTIRDEGKLMGYAVFFMQMHPHYSSHRFAVQDVVYLDPSLRGKMIGYKMIKFADEQLSKRGVSVVAHHVKPAHDFGPMLERLGYQLAEKIYSKRIG